MAGVIIKSRKSSLSAKTNADILARLNVQLPELPIMNFSSIRSRLFTTPGNHCMSYMICMISLIFFKGILQNLMISKDAKNTILKSIVKVFQSSDKIIFATYVVLFALILFYNTNDLYDFLEWDSVKKQKIFSHFSVENDDIHLIPILCVQNHVPGTDFIHFARNF